ncbi:hypothetical protein D3C86_2092690 [compost metagenome]
MECCRINASAKRTSGWRNYKVISARQPGNAVQQNDNVFFVLNQTECPLQYKLCNFDMVLGKLIEG